jgi:hypothetical protein
MYGFATFVFIVQGQCYFYVTDGWGIYPSFIPDGDQIVSKPYMTRVDSENTRLRHYLARSHRVFVVLLQVRGKAETFDSIVTSLPKILRCACSKLIHILIQQRHLCSNLKSTSLLNQSQQIRLRENCNSQSLSFF